MTLRITPDLMAAGYDFLREAKPFKAWKLPSSDDIQFRVVGDRTADAEFSLIGGIPTICVSDHGVGHTITLLAALAHEMCHLRQHIEKWRCNHGARFQRMAAAVCREHGLDLKTF